MAVAGCPRRKRRFEALIASLLAEGAALARVLIEAVNGILEKAETRSAAEQSVALLVGVFCKGAAKG